MTTPKLHIAQSHKCAKVAARLLVAVIVVISGELIVALSCLWLNSATHCNNDTESFWQLLGIACCFLLHLIGSIDC